jgi:hypothetical protein
MTFSFKIGTTRNMKRLILLLLVIPNFALQAQNKEGLVFGKSITETSAHFLGYPYCGGPLGEGPNGRYDQDSLCDTYDFDCQTYVETVIALNRSKNQKDYEQQMNQIRYLDGVVKYEMRLHFSETQWIPENERRGYFEDVSCELAECTEVPIKVDYFNWYKDKKEKDLVVAEFSKDLLDELHTMIEPGEPEPVPFKYIAKEKITAELIATFPNEAVVIIVRNSPTDARCQPKMVTHMGLVIDTQEGRMLRHATPLEKFKKVVDVKLSDYLEQFKTQSSAVGIKVLKINPVVTAN